MDKPIKLSGLQSVKLFFPYNEELLNWIKSLEGPAVYHKKLTMWELPIYHLADALDTLVHYDQVDLTIQQNETSEISEPPLSEIEQISFKHKPYAHQVEAINYGLAHGKWLNLSGMGLGKTFEAIGLAETLYHRGLIDHCLVICGVDSLRQNWKAEIKQFSDLPVRVLGEHITKNNTVRYETLAKRAEELKNKIDEFFVVVNITNVRDDKFVEAFKKSVNKFDLIIFDEAHHCLTGNTLIKTDLGEKTIKDIVTQKLNCKVLSYNTRTGKNEFNDINFWSELFPTEPIIELEILADDQTIKILRCTESHKIYTTNRGYVKAKDLTAEDGIKLFAKLDRGS